MICAPSYALFPSFYSQLRTGPFDSGQEQAYTYPRKLLNADWRMSPPDSTERESCPLSLPPFLSSTNHEIVAWSESKVDWPPDRNCLS